MNPRMPRMPKSDLAEVTTYNPPKKRYKNLHKNQTLKKLLELRQCLSVSLGTLARPLIVNQVRFWLEFNRCWVACWHTFHHFLTQKHTWLVLFVAGPTLGGILARIMQIRGLARLRGSVLKDIWYTIWYIYIWSQAPPGPTFWRA